MAERARAAVLRAGLCVVVLLGATIVVEAYFRFRESTPDDVSAVALQVGGSILTARDEPFVRSLDGERIYGRPGSARDRVLCLGDSFAFSWGVPYPQSFAAHLERRMNGGRFHGRRRVYNLGWPASGLVDGKMRYDRVSGKLAADTVLLVNGWNLAGRTYAELHREKDPFSERARRGLFTRSATGRTILNALSRRKQSGVPQVHEIGPAGVKEFERVFGSFVADVRAHKARLVMVMADCDADARRLMKKICASYSVPYYEQEFACDAETGRYRSFDKHFNSRGNERMATDVARLLGP